MANELSALRDTRFFGEINFSSVDLITWPSGSLPGTALQAGADVLRSQLKLDNLMPITLPIELFRVAGTGALLGTAAGTPAGAFGITYGAHGTNTPKMVGESASGNSKTNTARIVRELIPEYAAAQSVTLRVHARITVNANTSQTLDAQVFKSDGESGPDGADLYAGVAAPLTTSWANHDFILTSSALSAGDELDIELTGVADDTGGSAGAVIEIGKCQILADLRG